MSNEVAEAAAAEAVAAVASVAVAAANANAAEGCGHEIWDKDTYLADGYCPICMMKRIESQQARIEKLEAALQTDKEPDGD